MKNQAMRRFRYFTALLVCMLLLSSFTTERKVKIFMIGDSTMANKDISGGGLERGWGMMLKNFFTDDVIIDNHAKNGRSSKSFISEGLWRKVCEQIKPGDYVFIQFGHNDEKQDTARHTEPGIGTDPWLMKTWSKQNAASEDCPLEAFAKRRFLCHRQSQPRIRH